MATNIISAKFCADQTRAWTDELWQYDYGQILKFDGLELPDAYEVHFSNQPLTGETITQIGNADGVTIPDQFLQSGEVVYAWVYLHAGEDDGETEYMVTIPVSKRPEPSDEQPTPVEQSAIDQAIAALNIAVEKADEAITHYPQIQSGTWWVWDVTAEEYVDTEVEARGPQGIQGIPGQDGEDGAPGAPGEDGFSPEITVQDITGGHRITITDATGTNTVDVMDGEDGQPGAPGQPGQPGATGNGIASITKTGTVGLVDTYTITYTNGTTTTFTVTNGSDATVTVDDELSSTSENPVQNKVINSAISGLSDDINHKQDAPSTLGTDGQIMGLAMINGQLVPVWINPLDVQINGASIVDANNVADIPVATASDLGLVKVDANNGIGIESQNKLYINYANDTIIKSGTGNYRPISPPRQHQSVFYGLAKASGDTTQSASSNPVGAYTDDAKVKIQKMLGIYEAPWELIREDTVTNATEANIDITVDGNGNPFELTDCLLQFDTPTQETQSSLNGGVQLYHGVGYLNRFNAEVGTYTQAANATGRGAFVSYTQEGILIKIGSRGAALSGNLGALYYRQSTQEKASGIYYNSTGETLNIIRAVITNVTGTMHYRLFGRRAWS